TFVLLLGCHLTRSCRAFSFPAHYHGFCPQQREVVWNLLLQDGSEGPPLIDYSVTQKRRLSPPLLLMAHSERQFQRELDHARIRDRPFSIESAASGCDRPKQSRITQTGIGLAEIRMIENIEELRTELQACLFTDTKVAVYAGVQYFVGRTPKPVSPQVAERADHGVAEATCVKPCQARLDTGRAGGGVAAAHVIGIRWSTSAYTRLIAAGSNGEGGSGLHCGDAG